MSERMPLEEELRIRREAIADCNRSLAELRQWIARQPKDVGQLRECQCGCKFMVTVAYSGPECNGCRQRTYERNMFGTS